MEFLGLNVGKNGAEIKSYKTEAIRNWPKPTSVTEIRSFLGLVQFFRRFIRDFLGISAPLTNLTKNNMFMLNCDKRCDEAFDSLNKYNN